MPSRSFLRPRRYENPNGPCVTQVARNFCTELEEAGRRFLIRDRDTKFTASFDQIFASIGAKTILTPSANAFAERWVRIVREDCLDHLLVVSEHHLESVLAEYVTHYNRGPAVSQSGPRATAPKHDPSARGRRPP